MPIVDLSFVLTGNTLPADHGYALYGAISRILPALHPPGIALVEQGADPIWKDVGIHPIFGANAGNRLILLGPHSRLRLRVPSEMTSEVLCLAGKRLDVDGCALLVGVPQIQSLIPAPTLRCRMAVIKGYMEPEPFLESAQKSLRELGIGGRAALVPRSAGPSREGRYSSIEGRSPWIRRTLRVRDKTIVGYALTVSELTAEESILLQEKGIGGRRRLGCGIFVPVKE
ncbi:MAG: type I-MYXAN CRISPR-associated protein Cas6/Cmx6 [Candidatus Hydrogenedentes bacterium]|nr:type I-MYXAN CRISPR-associated protein Cas6/Cmx6 [Candidatus Hydrogenedentota bacterium]